MGSQYKCIAFGSCDQAGNLQWASGGSPTCQACGGPMRQVVGAKTRGASVGYRVAAFAFLAAVVLALVWIWLAPRGVAVPERHLLGHWQAEGTTLMGVALPVGVRLEFTPDAAVVMDQRLKVASYRTEGDRVHVQVVAAGGLGLNLPFRFLEADRVVYEGPMGIEVRYRRSKDVP